MSSSELTTGSGDTADRNVSWLVDGSFFTLLFLGFASIVASLVMFDRDQDIAAFLMRLVFAFFALSSAEIAVIGVVLVVRPACLGGIAGWSVAQMTTHPRRYGATQIWSGVLACASLGLCAYALPGLLPLRSATLPPLSDWIPIAQVVPVLVAAYTPAVIHLSRERRLRTTSHGRTA